VKKWISVCCLSLLVLFLLPPGVQSHSGGLDKNGCHTNRKTGEYHCHGAPKTESNTSGSSDKATSSTSPTTSSPVTSSDLKYLSAVNPIDPAKPIDTFSAKVTSIIDGDTIEVLHEGKSEKIRLYGIDCPEGGQSFSKEATQYASSLTFEKKITVRGYELDKYGRTVADVVLPDGIVLNREIVRNGYGWWFRKYAPLNLILEKLESEAKQAKRGLWSGKNPTPPWEYRKEGNSATTLTDTNTTTPNLTAQDDQEETVYVTRTGSKYHRPGCRYLKSSIPMKLSEAKTRYSPCSVCRPHD